MNGRHDGGGDRPAVDEDAMLHVPAFDLPASVAWSFPYHHRMSESQDAYRTIANFFDRYLVA